MAETESKSLSRWDPFAELDVFEGWPLRSRMQRLMEEAFGGRPPAPGRLVPAVDVSEADDHYSISVELPGVKKEDVTVETVDNVMTVRGEKRSEREEKKEHSHRVERSYGSFSRSFTLPANAVGDRIDAKFKSGVLTIEIPKREETKPKTISIK